MFTEVEQVYVLNEVFNDENTGEIISDGDSIFDSNYIRLVTSETHVISDTESSNGSDEQEHINTELGGVSNCLCGKI